MDNSVMSLKPQVMTLIKHHVNLRLDIFLQTSQTDCSRLRGTDTSTQTPVHYSAVEYNGHTTNIALVKIMAMFS